ncbi:AMP-binding protein [Atopobacter phocae]|uniref:AMP-binding protein n=1 Tax=Atopobacter phocae TaxID=136492 RepID=UPI000470F46E|nr:AMP-binding protein [Atopobacter phocae]
MSIEFQQQPLYLYDHFEQAVQKFPNLSIHIDQSLQAFPEIKDTTTYAAVFEYIQKRVRQFNHYNISPGDHVILFKSEAIDTYWLAVAVAALGAIPVMVSYHFKPHVIRVFQERLNNPFIVFDQRTATVIEQLDSSYADRYIAIKDLIQQPEQAFQPTRLDENAISFITHTSGTTGIPKLICHSAQSMGWRVKWQMEVLAPIKERGTIAFHISPVHSRFNIGITSIMALGFPMLAIMNSKTDHIKELIPRFEPIALETHPNHFVQWSMLARRHPEVFSSIRYYHSTFDAINKETITPFLLSRPERDAIYMQVYGQSECGPSILRYHTLNTLPHVDFRNMGVGYKDLTQARIADANGHILPNNKPGHIHLLSKGRALTYYQEESRFNENVYDLWWDTGDFGYLNDSNELILLDRQIDLVDTLPSTLAIEDAVMDQLPWLAEMIIVRDPKGAAQPVLALHDGYEMNWTEWFQAIGNIPTLKEPIILAYNDIPRTATMKVQRRELEHQLFGQ